MQQYGILLIIPYTFGWDDDLNFISVTAGFYTSYSAPKHGGV